MTLTVKAGLSRLALCAVCTSIALSGALAVTVQAADVTNCYQIVQPGSYCPGMDGGVRHTYNNERTSWSTSVDYSCGQYLGQGMQRDSNPWGAPKYAAEGYCYVTQSFPNNTELLRGWMRNLSGYPWTFVNKTNY